MSEESILLLDQIDRLISTYQWTVGIFITIILGAVAFFSYVQWKIKKEQEEKIKNEITDSLSKDISEVIEPLIITSLKQISIIGVPDYKENIKTFESYLKLDEKYKFKDTVSEEIKDWKIFIVSNFKTRIEPVIGIEINERDLEKNKVLRNFYSESYSAKRMPDSDELARISRGLFHQRYDDKKRLSDLNELLDDYAAFYYKYKDL